jgi:short-subunit dehydrogenase
MDITQVMIVGATEGIGQRFGQLAATDHSHLYLVDRQTANLIQLEQRLACQGASSVQVITQNLTQPGVADHIYRHWLFANVIAPQPKPLHHLINVLSFLPWREEDQDPWQAEGPEPALHFSNLVALNELFAAEMVHQGRGSILNVLFRPSSAAPAIEEMFEVTRALMFDAAHGLTQQLTDTDVSVSTLIASDRSFWLQSDRPPAQWAHDFVPPTYSAKDIADYGYRVLKDQ